VQGQQTDSQNQSTYLEINVQEIFPASQVRLINANKQNLKWLPVCYG
jgi:hypothetical protein